MGGGYGLDGGDGLGWGWGSDFAHDNFAFGFVIMGHPLAGGFFGVVLGPLLAEDLFEGFLAGGGVVFGLGG